MMLQAKRRRSTCKGTKGAQGHLCGGEFECWIMMAVEWVHVIELCAGFRRDGKGGIKPYAMNVKAGQASTVRYRYIGSGGRGRFRGLPLWRVLCQQTRVCTLSSQYKRVADVPIEHRDFVLVKAYSLWVCGA